MMKMKMKKITAEITALICCAGLIGTMPFGSMRTYAAQAVHNDFEVNYDGWHGSTETVRLTAESGTGYDGSRGMTVTNRTEASEGASSSKGFYLSGGVEYSYGVKVMSETAETFRLHLMCLDMETGEETIVELDTAQAAPGKWTALSAVYAAPENSYEFCLTITTDSTSDFVFDEVTITSEERNSLDTVYAAASEMGLKDAFGQYFRVGNILNGGTVKNSTITASIIKDYNSIECENETKPDATLVQSQCSGTNIGVSLNSAAAIMDFCVQNGIAMRGHAFVWHSQTPSWFFKENYNANGAWVSEATMDARLESYIKNMFAAIETQYPELNLYAYDVVNEAVSDDSNRTANYGGAREAGDNNVTSGTSAWVSVYGDNSFVEKAFTFADKYAPEGCALYYNDYNEYWDHKRDCIYNMCKDLYEKGLLDGIGMQSHINANYDGFSGVAAYTTALQKYAGIGCDVQITELDITCENGTYTLDQQAEKYKAIFQAAIDINTGDSAGQVTAVCIWGPNDANTWIKTENTPLLYDTNHQPKAAYTALMSMIPESEWVEGGYAGGEIAAPEPNEYGWFFHDEFEGDTCTWQGRGAATIQTSDAAAYIGSESLLVQNREFAWNGAYRTLNARAFVPGEAFSFSANVMYDDGSAADTFYMKLQYTDAAGETQYSTIAEAAAVKGEWVQLANTNYRIPADAANMQLYLETAESTNNFYIDEAIGAVGGTAIQGAGGSITAVKGDVDLSGAITAFDVAAAKMGLVKGFASAESEYAADVNGNGSPEVIDMIQILNFVMGRIDRFENADADATIAAAYMQSVRQSMTTTVPESATASNSYGTLEAVTYYSKAAEKYKSANVLLPDGYRTNETYPVLYINHGIFGDQNSMLDDSMKIRAMAGNLAESGEAEKMIIVFTSMFTSKTSDQCTGITLENTLAYDAFLEDLTESLMPYIESK